MEFRYVATIVITSACAQYGQEGRITHENNSVCSNMSIT